MPVKLAGLTLGVVAVAVLLGLVSPKLEPQWSDPIPFVKASFGLEHSDGQNDGSGTQRIGYSQNDGQLGGGFVSDDSTVFYAAVTEANYWRGETKDFYTGKGWEASTPSETEPTSRYEAFHHPAVDIEHRRAEVSFEEGQARFQHLFYPGDLLTRSEVMNAEVLVDRYTTKAATIHLGNPTSLDYYEYGYASLAYHVEELHKIDGNDPDSIRSYYTQLPEQLPNRVGELAEEIANEGTSRYEQAKAIERYLSGPDFAYETDDVPVPNEDQDYVDQFLFETMRGYCDNFSTAMVVMLRTLDIPARWVKGFTAGELVDTLSDNRLVYEVSNSNAHSW